MQKKRLIAELRETGTDHDRVKLIFNIDVGVCLQTTFFPAFPQTFRVQAFSLSTVPDLRAACGVKRVAPAKRAQKNGRMSGRF